MYRAYLLTSAALSTALAVVLQSNEAQATCPSYQEAPTCSGTTGICSVNMTLYSAACASGETNTTLCSPSIVNALSDAGLYFSSGGKVSVSGTCVTEGKAFEIILPAGSYDLSQDSSPGTLHMDKNDNPILMDLPFGNDRPISDTERLIITGNSSGTTLVTGYGWKTVRGQQSSNNANGFSHFTLQNITFARNGASVSQGVLTAVTAPTTSGQPGSITFVVQGASSSLTGTIASGIQPPAGGGGSGYPYPYAIGFNSPAFSVGGTEGKYIRIYDNTGGVPTLDAGLSNGNSLCSVTVGTTATSFCNSQLSWDTCTDVYLQSGYYTNEINNDNGAGTYTLTNSSPSAGERQTLQWYAQLLSNGNKNPSGTSVIACVKSAGWGAGFAEFDDNKPGGSDIIFSGLTIKESAHVDFFGVHSDLTYPTSGDPGVKIVNTSIVREASSSGQYPCLSVSGGGFQLHGTDLNQAGNTPATSATYGNVITNLSVTAAADDALAFFDDVGGSYAGGVSFPTSTVQTSTLESPFVRAIEVNQGCSTTLTSTITGTAGVCYGPTVDSYTQTTGITHCYLDPTNNPPGCPVHRDPNG